MSKLSTSRITIADLVFDPLTQRQAHERVAQAIQHPRAQSFVYLKPYAEFFRPRPAAVTELLHQADLVMADGVSTQWAAAYLDDNRSGIKHFVWSLAAGLRNKRWLQHVLPERGAGVDTTHALFKLAEERGWTVGILGGPAGQHIQMAARLKQKYPDLKDLHTWSGYFTDTDEPHVAATIAAVHPDILFVAMGYPRQEGFIARHRTGLATVLIGEGGTFDYDQMGGPVKRAPRAWRAAGFEWLWRLIRQPKRLGRQLAIPGFMWQIYRLQIKKSR